MKNMACILAFLLVYPFLLFAAPADDNAAALERLDEVIKKKETYQKRKEKDIDVLKRQLSRSVAPADKYRLYGA